MSSAASARTKAQRKARRAYHQVQLVRPSVYEFLSVNDDFTDAVTDIPALAKSRRPLGVGGQETKGHDYRDRLAPLRYGVRQRMATEATQGVVVAWDLDLAHAVGTATDRPASLGGGWVPIIEPRHGDDMLVRGVVWQDIAIRGTGVRIRLASYHRPPWRHRDLWPAADRALERWLDASPLPVVLLTDANQAGGPDLDSTQWGWSGAGIDGAVTDVKVTSVYELEQRRSDHRPVSLAVRPSTIRRSTGVVRA